MRILLLFFLVLMLSGCANLSEAPKPPEMPVVVEVLEIVEVDPVMSLLQVEEESPYTEFMNSYLLEFLGRSTSMQKILMDPTPFKNALTDLAQDGMYCDQYETSFSNKIYYGPDAVLHTTPRMLARHLLIYDAIFFNDIPSHIGAMIERDLQDVRNMEVMPDEFGGFLMLNPEGLHFLPVPSRGFYKLSSKVAEEEGFESVSDVRMEEHRALTNHGFAHTLWLMGTVPNLGVFHLHATIRDMESDRCGPSSVDKENALELAELEGEYYSVLISSVGERRFVLTTLFSSLDEAGEAYLSIIEYPVMSY